jgi:predicted CXXCH cytochrome family protein
VSRHDHRWHVNCYFQVRTVNRNKPQTKEHMKKKLETCPSRIGRMRWTAILLIAAAFAGAGGTVMGQTIAGTPHDLSAKGWGTTELCKFCHVPHLAQNVVGAPLWNHQTTLATYTLYSSSTFLGSTTQTQPGPTSKLCLSCHDGTVANDSFANGGVLQAGTHFMTSTNLVGAGASLTRDHPISFTYDAALAASEGHLVTPASTNYVDAAHLVPLFSSKMECASCHASHNNQYGKFLRTSNAGSALCQKCHTL